MERGITGVYFIQNTTVGGLGEWPLGEEEKENFNQIGVIMYAVENINFTVKNFKLYDPIVIFPESLIRILTLNFLVFAIATKIELF